MITGNKGEWSEFYAFLKMISEKRLDAANENFEKIKDIFFPILKIIREEANGSMEYELLENDSVKILHAGTEIALVNSSDLKSKIAEIFRSIKDNNESSFTIPIANEMMKRFHTTRLSAGNTQKEDITLKIHNYYTGTEPEIGFSIKSMIGAASSLLNASPATNFIYKINGLNESKIDMINSIDSKSKIRDRLSAIVDAGGSFDFTGISSAIFKKNLQFIEYILPEIIAQIVLGYYMGKGKLLIDLIETISTDKNNTLAPDLDKQGYEFKIKDFLYDVALGMIPSKEWDGRMRAHGGYIVVREDGELVCYHVYNADAFRIYLLKNTRLETPSTSRHKFGKIYKEGNSFYIKLNLQIRFIK